MVNSVSLAYNAKRPAFASCKRVSELNKAMDNFPNRGAKMMSYGSTRLYKEIIMQKSANLQQTLDGLPLESDPTQTALNYSSMGRAVFTYGFS